MPETSEENAVTPVDAASLVILRGREEAPEVLLGKRRDDARFMPGYYVFPGGAVDPADRLLAESGDAGTRFHAAVARETWEEMGLLISKAGALPATIGPADPFYDLLRAKEQRPNHGALHFIARAVTPPPSPIRFDTRFFLAKEEDTDGQAHAAGELPEVLWVPAVRALGSDSVRGVTKFVLGEALALWQQPERLASPTRPIRRYAYVDGARMILQEAQSDGLA